VRKDEAGAGGGDAGGGGGGGGSDAADGSPEASWKNFIQEMLIKRGNVSDALICSCKDGKVFAATPNFTVSLAASCINISPFNNKIFLPMFLYTS
jgi:hypothetical protein